jgi:hypothetical protein
MMPKEKRKEELIKMNVAFMNSEVDEMGDNASLTTRLILDMLETNPS